MKANYSITALQYLLTIKANHMAVSLSTQNFTETGHIFDQFNTATDNANVRTFDKDLPSEQLLANTNT